MLLKRKANSPALSDAERLSGTSEALASGSSAWYRAGGDDLGETAEEPDEFSKLVDKNARNIDYQ